jgi:signal transduction histidine kinase/putative methionine-R-sulfoxide reductase with GAF domain/CheY-like chemotaxis protein
MMNWHPFLAHFSSIAMLLGAVVLSNLGRRKPPAAQPADQSQGDEALRRQLKELTILHAIATAGAAANDENTLIERATQIIGENLYPDNFGLLLLDESNGILWSHASYRERDTIRRVSAPIPIGEGICGIVAERGTPWRVDDVSQVPEYIRVDPETLSELCVPMWVGERVLGVVNAESTRLAAFTESDERLLATLAGQLATAIDRLRAEAAVRYQASQLAILSVASQEIVASLIPDQVYAAIHRAAAQLMPVQIFRIALIDPLSQQVEPVYSAGLADQIPQGWDAAQSELYWQVFTSGEPLLTEAKLSGDIPDRSAEARSRSILAVPLKLGSSILGLLACESDQPRAHHREDLQTLVTLANQAAIAIENARLFAETERRLSEITFLSQIIAVTATENDLTAALNRICAELAKFFSIPAVSFALFNAELTAAQVIAEYHAPDHPRRLGDLIPVIGSPAVSQVLEQSSPLEFSRPLEGQPDPDLDPLFRRAGIGSLLLMPIVFAGEVVGLLEICGQQPRSYSTREIELLEKVASQVGQVLERLGLFAATREQADRMAHLAAISERLNRPLSVAEVIKEIGEGVLALGRGNRSLIYVRQPEGPSGLAWSRGLSDEYLASVAGWETNHSHDILLHSAEPVLFSDMMAIPEGSTMRRLAEQEGYRAFAAWPLVYQDDVIAVVICYYDSPHSGSDAEHEVMLAFARQSAVALQNARLFEQIQQNASRVQQIIDTVPEGVLLLDEEMRVLLANPLAQEYLQTAQGDQQANFLALFKNQPLQEMLRPDAQVLWYEAELPGPPRRVFELSTQPLCISDKPGGWVVVLRDMTQERDNQARIQMQERLATVGQLAAGIAHDFNNILAAIIVYADLLKRDTSLTPASQERLSIIQEQVQRAASLIRQILDFSRRSIMEQSTLDLLPFIKELDKLLRRVLPENIRLELTYQPGSYLVKADPARLQQVFMNLAVNARDASPEGGVLRFELERIEIKAGAQPPCPEIPSGTWVRISIKDSGEGIPPEVMPHIFEPFYSTKPVGHGTGLGLAQAYGIIKQHDGYIDAHSQPGEGTVFHIYLTSQEQANEESPSIEPAGGVYGNGELLLLVEDDFSARSALQELLETYNYQVLTASNGLEALQLAEQCLGKLELVVTDLVMPGMGGIALYYELQKRWPATRILFVTGHPLRESDRAVLEEGRVSWLQKPFSIQDFTQMLRRILSENGRSG